MPAPFSTSTPSSVAPDAVSILTRPELVRLPPVMTVPRSSVSSPVTSIMPTLLTVSPSSALPLPLTLNCPKLPSEPFFQRGCTDKINDAIVGYGAAIDGSTAQRQYRIRVDLQLAGVGDIDQHIERPVQ